jgi:hypothetical protein
MRTLVREAVEAGREAAKAQAPDLPLPSLLDFFFAPNATALPRVQRKDWGRHLSAAFENFRVPAALVAATALSAAFALPPLDAVDSPAVALCKRLYLLASVGSFMSSMLTVALATSALVQLNERDSGRDSAAENLEDFISRSGFEMGRERWVAVNAHFILGVVALCGAVGLRCYVAFADRTFGRIAAMIVASGALTAISLGLPRGVLLKLVLRHIQAVVRRAVNLRSPAPALLLAVLLAVSAGYLTVQEVIAYVVKLQSNR